MLSKERSRIFIGILQIILLKVTEINLVTRSIRAHGNIYHLIQTYCLANQQIIIQT